MQIIPHCVLLRVTLTHGEIWRCSMSRMQYSRYSCNPGGNGNQKFVVSTLEKKNCQRIVKDKNAVKYIEKNFITLQRSGK